MILPRIKDATDAAALFQTQNPLRTLRPLREAN